MGVLLQPITLRSKAFGAITASYTVLGTPVAEGLAIRYLKNQTDAILVISEDGVNDHHQLDAGETKTTDITANRSRDEAVAMRKNIQYYVKYSGSAPTSGSAVVEGDHTP